MKKIGIIAILFITIAIGLYLYLSRDINIDMVIGNKKHPILSESTDTDITLFQSGDEWDPKVMRTEAPIDIGSGVTVTVSTNGPKGRSMTPTEIKEFGSRMQRK